MRGLAASLVASGYDVTVLCCKELGQPETPVPHYVIAVSNPLLRLMKLILGEQISRIPIQSKAAMLE